MSHKHLLILGVYFFSLSAHALGCYSGDREVGRGRRTDSVRCQAAGYCTAWGYNPNTGAYEYFYGYHQNCPGTQERSITVYHCLDHQGVGYTVEDPGFWGPCRVN